MSECTAEQLGRSSLEAFRAIAENSADLILRFDRQLRHVYVNPAAERRMRRPRHAIRGKTQRELGMIESVVQTWEEALERVFRSGRERRFEFALGSTWIDAQEEFEAFATPERDARGEIETVLVVVRDMTERARGQTALAAQEASLRAAQRIAGCGSFTWESATNALRCSEELHRLLGLSCDEAIALDDLLALVHEDDRSRVRRTLEDAARTGRPWSMQLRVRDRDGGERVLHSRGERATDGDGVRLYGTALDVTEQEDVQSTVRQLLRFSQFAVERIDDAVLWIDASGRILSANRAAGDRFGERAESLVGQPVGRLGLKEPAESWGERWEQLQRAGRLRYEVAQPGGAPLEICAHHAALNGQQYACLIVARERRPAASRAFEMARDLLTPLLDSARAQERLLESMLATGGPGEALPDPSVSHLLGDEELEIRGVGQLRALAAQS